MLKAVGHPRASQQTARQEDRRFVFERSVAQDPADCRDIAAVELLSAQFFAANPPRHNKLGVRTIVEVTGWFRGAPKQ